MLRLQPPRAPVNPGAVDTERFLFRDRIDALGAVVPTALGRREARRRAGLARVARVDRRAHPRQRGRPRCRRAGRRSRGRGDRRHDPRAMARVRRHRHGAPGRDLRAARDDVRLARDPRGAAHLAPGAARPMVRPRATRRRRRDRRRRRLCLAGRLLGADAAHAADARDLVGRAAGRAAAGRPGGDRAGAARRYCCSTRSRRSRPGSGCRSPRSGCWSPPTGWRSATTRARRTPPARPARRAGRRGCGRPAAAGLARARAALRAMVVTQWRITAALAPATLLLFGSVPLAGLVANLLAIPLFSVLLVPLILASLAAWPLAPAVATAGWRLAEQRLPRQLAAARGARRPAGRRVVGRAGARVAAGRTAVAALAAAAGPARCCGSARRWCCCRCSPRRGWRSRRGSSPRCCSTAATASRCWC